MNMFSSQKMNDMFSPPRKPTGAAVTSAMEHIFGLMELNKRKLMGHNFSPHRKAIHKVCRNLWTSTCLASQVVKLAILVNRQHALWITAMLDSASFISVSITSSACRRSFLCDASAHIRKPKERKFNRKGYKWYFRRKARKYLWRLRSNKRKEYWFQFRAQCTLACFQRHRFTMHSLENRRVWLRKKVFKMDFACLVFPNFTNTCHIPIWRPELTQSSMQLQ